MLTLPLLSSRSAPLGWAALPVLFASLALAPGAIAETGAPPAAKAAVVTLTGLRITDTTVGSGPSPHVGQTCAINYTSWLYVNGEKGDRIESSVDGGRAYSFVFGKGQVRREWDEGLATMKSGGKRTIIAPAQIGVAPPEPSPELPGMGGERSARFQPSGLLYEIELLGCR